MANPNLAQEWTDLLLDAIRDRDQSKEYFEAFNDKVQAIYGNEMWTWWNEGLENLIRGSIFKDFDPLYGIHVTREFLLEKCSDSMDDIQKVIELIQENQYDKTLKENYMGEEGYKAISQTPFFLPFLFCAVSGEYLIQLLHPEEPFYFPCYFKEEDQLVDYKKAQKEKYFGTHREKRSSTYCARLEKALCVDVAYYKKHSRKELWKLCEILEYIDSCRTGPKDVFKILSDAARYSYDVNLTMVQYKTEWNEQEKITLLLKTLLLRGIPYETHFSFLMQVNLYVFAIQRIMQQVYIYIQSDSLLMMCSSLQGNTSAGRKLLRDYLRKMDEFMAYQRGSTAESQENRNIFQDVLWKMALNSGIQYMAVDTSFIDWVRRNCPPVDARGLLLEYGIHPVTVRIDAKGAAIKQHRALFDALFPGVSGRKLVRLWQIAVKYLLASPFTLSLTAMPKQKGIHKRLELPAGRQYTISLVEISIRMWLAYIGKEYPVPKEWYYHKKYSPIRLYNVMDNINNYSSFKILVSLDFACNYLRFALGGYTANYAEWEEIIDGFNSLWRNLSKGKLSAEASMKQIDACTREFKQVRDELKRYVEGDFDEIHQSNA